MESASVEDNNLNIIKMMVCGANEGCVEKYGKWPCFAFEKDMGNNSIQFSNCIKWGQKQCSGFRCTLRIAEYAFGAGCTRIKKMRL